jgi:mannose-1-phosphate guanylyltransferase
VAAPERTWVVVSRDLAPLARRALREHPCAHLLVEPAARNTAAAIALAAARVAGAGGRLLGVFPSDHYIADPHEFARTLARAARAAAAGEHLLLVGIPPTRPDTAYGYLRVGGRSGGVLRVLRFEEKPSLPRARRYAAGGRHLWNAGMLVATPGRLLSETRSHAPAVWRALGGVLDDVAAGRRVSRGRLAAAWRRSPAISFDHAVLERSRRVLAVRGRFGWSDLGSWDSLAEHLPRVAGNRVRGAPPAATLDAPGNVIWNTTDKAVVLLGVSGLAVVETEDALLVCALDRAQEVRRVADELSRRRGELT